MNFPITITRGINWIRNNKWNQVLNSSSRESNTPILHAVHSEKERGIEERRGENKTVSFVSPFLCIKMATVNTRPRLNIRHICILRPT